MNGTDMGRRGFLLRCGKTAAVGAAGVGLAAWGSWRQKSPQPPLARSLDDLTARFAREETGVADDAFDARLAELKSLEAELITAPDEQFRFHSGVPAG